MHLNSSKDHVFNNTMNLNLLNKRNKFKNLLLLLNSSSIEKILKKGYAIVKQN